MFCLNNDLTSVMKQHHISTVIREMMGSVYTNTTYNGICLRDSTIVHAIVGVHRADS